MSDAPSDHERFVREVVADPWLGHRVLFRARNELPNAPFHRDICHDFWRAGPKQILGFRGCAKSTIGERNMALAGAMVSFQNIIIIGANEARAVERLTVVSWHLKTNERLKVVFGDQRGSSWTQTRIVLRGGNCIQALGRDQDIRGIKHMDWRPDFVFVDDFEDEESVQTPDQRKKTMDWFLGPLLLACEPEARILVNGTPLDRESVPVQLERAGWPTRKIPVEYLDEAGERRASWPEKFPLTWIDEKRKLYITLGKLPLWMSEMMVDASAAEVSVFHSEMFRVEERMRSWHAVYAMIDPGREPGRKSAMTGWAVWSWMAGRLHVWSAGAAMLMPDQIVDLLFGLNEEFSPVWLGIEKTGLGQWASQPIRQEQARRGVILPLRLVEAPRGEGGQTGFIRGLQPFYSAGEVTHQMPLPELEEQLMSFPTGKRDAPNALAYALIMRPGQVIYDNFTEDNIAYDLEPIGGSALYLAANATSSLTAAALLQVADGQLRVYADWVSEGLPETAVADVAALAALVGDTSTKHMARSARWDWREALKLPERRTEWGREPIRWVVPPKHGDQWNNVGLMQAIARLPANCARGSLEAGGRAHLAQCFASLSRGAPAVVVSDRAKWTLRALSGGYARSVTRGAALAPEADDGPYRLLMEGIESFAGQMATAEQASELPQNYSYNRAGERYLSAMPQRR